MTNVTVPTPGNLVVPLSAIIDQLQGKLTSADLNALLLAVVGQRRNQVQPGDLITADLFNQVLQDIQDLNTQLAALSGGGGASQPGNADAVATFQDTWNFYGTLVKNNEFLPAADSVDAIQSTARINAYLQDVMYAALAGSGLGYTAGTQALLDAFLRLYQRQADLVVLFSAAIPGIADTTAQRQFATLLGTLLEQNDALGHLSLHNALNARDLPSTIAAQDRINAMVRDESGDVTTGNLEVLYLGAVGTSETLVIGSATPVLYRFKVTNRTNRNVTANFSAAFLPPKQAWNQLSVVDTNGAALPSLQMTPFNQQNATDTGATREVRVAVMTPTGAANGDTGTLQFTADVPAPIGRRASASRALTVANAAVQQTPGVITYTPDSPVVSDDFNNATQLVPITFQYKFSFGALTGPASRSFRFRVDISAPANVDTFFFFEFAPADLTIDTGSSTQVSKTSPAFTLADGQQRSGTVSITPLSGALNKSVTFTVSVQSATDNVIATSAPITMKVTH